MPTKFAFPVLVALVASALVVAPAAATEDMAIMKTLFQNDGEGFTPPATNKALQALLAKKPALNFFEACGAGDPAEIARQLKRDPKLATAWTDFGWSGLHLPAFSRL